MLNGQVAHLNLSESIITFLLSGSRHCADIDKLVDTLCYSPEITYKYICNKVGLD